MATSIFDNLVECLIKREGPTIFHIGRTQYIFAPRPELTGDFNASVCVVISKEHRDYLLNDSATKAYYRKYDPKENHVPDVDAAERAEFEAWRELRKTMTQEELIKVEQDRLAPKEAELPALPLAQPAAPAAPAPSQAKQQRKQAAQSAPVVDAADEILDALEPPERGADPDKIEVF